MFQNSAKIGSRKDLVDSTPDLYRTCSGASRFGGMARPLFLKNFDTGWYNGSIIFRTRNSGVLPI